MDQTVSERVFTHIRRKIATGEYSPGHDLVVQVLARELGVSRTPVVEALHQLEREYLVKIDRTMVKTAKVLALGRHDEILDYREALELFAIRRAVEGMNRPGLKRLADKLEEMQPLTDSVLRDPGRREVQQRLLQKNIEFHLLIFDMADNRHLLREYEKILRVLHAFFLRRLNTGDGKAFSEGAELNHLEHCAVFKYLQLGDAEAACKTMRSHINRSAHLVTGLSLLETPFPA